MPVDLLLGEILRLTQGLGIEYGAGAEFERLETLVGIGDVLSEEYHAVIFHYDSLVLRILPELLDYLAAQQFAAGEGIFGETDRAADGPCLGTDAGVGNLVHDTECHQSRGMGVND